MKKEYKRPTIEMEQFTLAAHIASCGLGANSGNSFGKPLHQNSDCAWQDAFGNHIFADKVDSQCEDKYGDGEYEGICYNTPSLSNRIFAS